MIVFDTETTGLIGNPAMPLADQPYIIELAAIKLDDETLEEVERLHLLVKPPMALPQKIIDITRITDDMLTDAPPFTKVILQLANFFVGERKCVAHNCSFDIGMLKLELRRQDWVTRFPWPFWHLCTVELNMDIKGRRMKLGDLYTHVTGKTIAGAHRAMTDVEALVEVVRWMRTEHKL